jgi:hypothetical protein
MYAIINIPGSSHFEYHGPDSRANCEFWLSNRVAKLLETEQVTSTLPRRIVSNRQAESWKYRDGSRVIRHAELPEIGCQCQNCGTDIPLEFSPRDFCPTCEMFCVLQKDGSVKHVL